MEILFIIILIIIAYLYSSVGHGGASGYLALMAIFSFDPSVMKSTALTLNLFVAGVAFINYYRGGYFRWRLLLPFAIASMPMAFLGAMVEINPKAYKIILAVFLLIAVARMLFFKGYKSQDSRNPSFMLSVLIGVLLGFFSGMIGIGGGIILTPLLLLLHWANVKEAAAASALFIFLNSGAGLLGVAQSGISYSPEILTFIICGLIGGLIGSYSGSFRYSSVLLRYLLAIVLVAASAKLFII